MWQMVKTVILLAEEVKLRTLVGCPSSLLSVITHHQSNLVQRTLHALLVNQAGIIFQTNIKPIGVVLRQDINMSPVQ